MDKAGFHDMNLLSTVICDLWHLSFFLIPVASCFDNEMRIGNQNLAFYFVFSVAVKCYVREGVGSRLKRWILTYLLRFWTICSCLRCELLVGCFVAVVWQSFGGGCLFFKCCKSYLCKETWPCSDVFVVFGELELGWFGVFLFWGIFPFQQTSLSLLVSCQYTVHFCAIYTQ